jgi:4-amino-4-deoxy-L-arabinose transferase-like glycosyltransferase
LICICFAAGVTWSARHHIITDGVSYLDIASEVNSGDLAALGNSYWSPAYPALIGAGLFLLRPSAANEVPVLQLVNFVIFILTLGAFSLFFRYWSRSIPEFERAGIRDKGLFTLFAFASFLWFTASLVIVPFPTPDMMVVAIVLFVAAMGCRLSQPGACWKHFAGLGALLGLGIYVKSALFPLAFVFIALFFISLARSSDIPRRRQLAFLALTTAMCTVVAAPLIVCMSMQAGKFTTGEAGKLNYLWNVNRFEPNHVGWSGGTAPEYGTPLHPPRKLMENPTVLEFETPTAETYPLWHSPGYWYAGAKTVFSWHKQIHGISESLEEYGKIAVRAIGFIGGAIVLFALGMSKGKRAQRWRISFWLLAWPLAGCAMYSIVRLHPRYVAAFLLILCLEVYRALVFRVGRRVSIGVCAIALLVVMTPLFLRASKTFATSVRQLRHPVDEEYVVAAHNLQHLGLQPGDKVAVAGFALNCFYARYDRLRIVSQILTPDDFWRLNPSDAKRVEDRLASIGVKALIVFDHPARKQEAGWTDVGAFGGGSLSVLLLQPASEPSHLPNLALGPGLADKSGAQSPVDAGDRNPQASTPPDSDE